MLASSPAALPPLLYSQKTEQRSLWLTELAELISIPTVSAQPQHRKDLRTCANWLAQHLRKIGLQHIEVLPGSNGGHPSVCRGMARLSFRLVPDQNPQEIAQLLQQHIAATTPPAVRSRLSIKGGVHPVLLPKNSPVMQAAQRAVIQTWGVPPCFTRSGGSIPLVAQFHRRFRVPIVLLGFGLPDDDVHAPNEKMNLSNFFRGVETVIRFLMEYGT